MVGGDDIAVRAAIAPVLGGKPNEFTAHVMPAIGSGHSPLGPLRGHGSPSDDDPWEDVLEREREPEPRCWFPDGRLDAALEVFADFVDLKVAFMAGHSREVATLAASAAGDSTLRRVGLLHDLGRVAVSNGVWEKPGPLSDGRGSGSGCTPITPSGSSSAYSRCVGSRGSRECTMNGGTALTITVAVRARKSVGP